MLLLLLQWLQGVSLLLQEFCGGVIVAVAMTLWGVIVAVAMTVGCFIAVAKTGVFHCCCKDWGVSLLL